MKILSVRLKELRHDLKISQAKISYELGIAQTTYAAYETNRSQPSIEVLDKISTFFDVSIDYLLGKSNVKATQAEVDFSNEVSKKGIDQMIKEYNLTLGDEAMDPEEERKLIKLIELFVGSE